MTLPAAPSVVIASGAVNWEQATCHGSRLTEGWSVVAIKRCDYSDILLPGGPFGDFTYVHETLGSYCKWPDTCIIKKTKVIG